MADETKNPTQESDFADERSGLNPTPENPAGTATATNVTYPSPVSEDDFLSDEEEKAHAKAKDEGGAYPESIGRFVLGTLANTPGSAGRLVGSIADAVTSPRQTLRGIGGLIAGGVEKSVGMTPETPTTSGIGAFFGGNHVQFADDFLHFFEKRYIGKDQKGQWNALKTLYNDDVGLAADISTLFSGGASALKGGAQAARIAGAGGLASTLAKTGEVAGQISHYTNPLTPITAGVKAGVGAALPDPRKMYLEALKPSMETKIEGLTGKTPDYPEIATTALESKIPIGMGGVGKLHGLIDKLHQTYMDLINANPQAAPVVPSDVTSRLARSKTQYNWAAPSADQAAINAIGEDFMKQHTSTTPAAYSPTGPPFYTPPTTTEVPIPLNIAQDIKTKTYAKIREQYGQPGSAAVEATKDLARGLKEEIAGSLSNISGVDVSALTAKESKFLGLDQALERAVAREMTKSGSAVRNMALGAAAGAVSGHGLVGTTIGFLKGVVSDPEVKSKLAIAINTVEQRLSKGAPGAKSKPSMALALRAVSELQNSLESYQPVQEQANPNQPQSPSVATDNDFLPE